MLHETQPYKSAEELTDEYVEQMTPQQRKVMEIAREHLQSSFSLVKSIGFKEWCDSLPK
jgi:hypothetical protein